MFSIDQRFIQTNFGFCFGGLHKIQVDSTFFFLYCEFFLFFNMQAVNCEAFRSQPQEFLFICIGCLISLRLHSSYVIVTLVLIVFSFLQFFYSSLLDLIWVITQGYTNFASTLFLEICMFEKLLTTSTLIISYQLFWLRMGGLETQTPSLRGLWS